MMIKPLLRTLAIAFAAVLFTTACSSDSPTSSIALSQPDPGTNISGSATNSQTEASGVIYFTTTDGEMQTLTPSTGSLGMLWDPALQEGRDLVLEVSAADRSTGVYVLTAGPDELLDTSLTQIVDGQLQPVSSSEPTSGLVCLDTHANATTTVGHFVTPSFDNTQGTTFVQFVLGPDADSVIELNRNSTTCPRYNSTRSVVMTSMLTTPGDVTTESVVIDGPQGTHEISIDGCGLTPRTFSPGDEWALVAVVCYSENWDLSGLYAIPFADLMTVTELSEMTRIGSGVYGRTAWHPDGGWIVANRYDAQSNQTPARTLEDDRGSLVLISTTGDVSTYPILGQAQPHSVHWAHDSVQAGS